MSVRQEKAAQETAIVPAGVDAATENALAEGASFAVATPENPLKRTLVISIRASLNELCLQRERGVWKPSAEALRNIFQ